MNYTVAVYAHPASNSNAEVAYQFAKALLGQQHSINRLFFFGEGVYNGVDDHENPLPGLWQQLIAQHKLDAVICVTAAAARGIGNQTDQKPPLDGFDISGLGQLIDAGASSDRFITFG